MSVKNTETINNTKFSMDEEENGRIKEYRISKLNEDIDITKSSFNRNEASYDNYYVKEQVRNNQVY